eukprot:COSAG05_NODE_11592_length_506_cov_0.791155_1_plen_46_part_10
MSAIGSADWPNFLANATTLILASNSFLESKFVKFARPCNAGNFIAL